MHSQAESDHIHTHMTDSTRTQAGQDRTDKSPLLAGTSIHSSTLLSMTNRECLGEIGLCEQRWRYHILSNQDNVIIEWQGDQSVSVSCESLSQCECIVI